jgi:hypothetical protein
MHNTAFGLPKPDPLYFVTDPDFSSFPALKCFQIDITKSCFLAAKLTTGEK